MYYNPKNNAQIKKLILFLFLFFIYDLLDSEFFEGYNKKIIVNLVILQLFEK